MYTIYASVKVVMSSSYKFKISGSWLYPVSYVRDRVAERRTCLGVKEGI